MAQDRSDELRGVLPALFLVALATVMFEVLLTRIFSLTMWFHFAFMAISLAMFGLTVGALLVFLRPEGWPQATLKRSMGANALLLAVMGILMGMAFPLGMRLAMASRRELAPWLWGVNGATSVLASVLAVIIAMALGINASFWTGVAAYAVALATFAFAARASRL